MKTFDRFKTYWNGQGTYQAEHELLAKALVPLAGKASTGDGEALRALSRIYHDMYNNGGGNLLGPDEDGEYTEISEDTRALIRKMALVCGTQWLTPHSAILEGVILRNLEGPQEDQDREALEQIADLVIRCVILNRLAKSVA